MCQQREIPKFSELAGCTCGCCRCGCGQSFRSFFSAKEKLERLGSYRDQLKKELTGVEECIKELKNK
ncbi:MAG: hypothetical protein R6W88_11520 [Desulfobacterales bacterium]